MKSAEIVKAMSLVKEFQNGLEKTRVLKELNFSVSSGQLVAITGKSGSGKSTLLYQLGLLDHPTSGSITIENVETTQLSSSQRTHLRLTKLGYIFQNYALLPSLTAIENVMVPLLMQNYSQPKAHQKAQEALEKVGLADRLDFRPSQLSGGQQQRVSIARAIGHDPAIIFADEPTANLDSETSDMIMEVFLNLHQAGQTIVLVTHESEYAKKADKVFNLKDGVFVKPV